jgi:hypothetical protein
MKLIFINTCIVRVKYSKIQFDILFHIHQIIPKQGLFFFKHIVKYAHLFSL